MKQLYRFTFPKQTRRSLIEQAIADAIFATECLHGPSKVRLGAGYYLARGRSQCVIETGSKVGEQIAQLFAGYMNRELGPETYRVERLEPGECE